MYNHLTTVSLWGSAMELEQYFCDQTPDLWGTFDTAAVKIQPGCPLPNMKRLQGHCKTNFLYWESFPKEPSYAFNSRETPQTGS